MWETWIWSLGWEDPLEKGMATYSSILAWRFPMDRGALWATVHRVIKSQAWLSTAQWRTNIIVFNTLLFPSFSFLSSKWYLFVFHTDRIPLLLDLLWSSTVISVSLRNLFQEPLIYQNSKMLKFLRSNVVVFAYNPHTLSCIYFFKL